MKILKSALSMVLACGTVALVNSPALADEQPQQLSAETIAKLYSSCQSNDATSCSKLGIAYRTGEGVKKDFTKAKSLLEKACELKDGAGCNALGDLYYLNLKLIG